MVERRWWTARQQRQRARTLQSERSAGTPLHPAGIAARVDPQTGKATYATAGAWRGADDAGREALWHTFTAEERTSVRVALRGGLGSEMWPLIDSHALHRLDHIAIADE